MIVMGQQSGDRQSRIFAIITLALLVLSVALILVLAMSQPESTRLAREAYAAFLQNEPEARTLVEKLYRQFPSDPNAIIIAAEFAAKKFEHQRAIELYQQLPKDSARWELAASLGLAKRYRVLGKQLEEEAALQRAIEIDPVNTEAHHRLGHLLQVQGRTWDSIPSFMNQIRRGKCRGDELMGVASTERFFRADDDIEFAVARSASREAVTQLGNARRFLFENRNTEAETLLREIIAESPRIGEAQGRLGRLLVESGRLAEFFEWLKNLPDGARQHPEVWFIQGLQARRFGDIRGASHCFLQTIRLSPNHLPATVYNQINFSGVHPGWTCCGDAVGDANGAVLRQATITTALCPSSPLEKKRDTGGGPTTITQYHGIMGATTGNGYTNPASSTAPCCSCCGGQQGTGNITGSGSLVVARSIGFSDMTDGTSNIMVVGEASNFIWTAAQSAGGTKTVAVNGAHGIMMGSPDVLTVEERNRIHGQNNYTFERPFNLTTVRYAPNAPAINNDANWPGVGDNYGSNNPLSSAHTGGVQILLGDGSARFLSENVDMLTLRRLATRNDGQVLGEF